jgi:endoglucanase
MTGLASANTDYVRGMIDWCKEFRGYRPDGSVNICWDVVNYHYYSNNSNSSQNGIATRGTAPELSTTIKVADSFVQMAHRELNNMPVWVTELGYDANQGSPYKAIPIGNKTEYITQADWNLRSALLYNRLGIERSFFYLLYDDNFDNPTQFASSGFLNTDKSRKPTADFLFQASKLVGDYLYKETLSTNPVVDRYELNGQSAYILYIPDEKGLTATHSLTVNNFNQVKVYTPKAGSDVMDVVTMPVVAGKVSLTISETPIFVLPSNAAARIATAETDSDIDASLKSFVVFPNPVSDYIIFSLDNTHVGTLAISVYDANSSRVFKNEHFIKRDRTLKEKIDIRNLPLGIYVLEIKQGSETAFRKILKVE